MIIQSVTEDLYFSVHVNLSCILLHSQCATLYLSPFSTLSLLLHFFLLCFEFFLMRLSSDSHLYTVPSLPILQLKSCSIIQVSTLSLVQTFYNFFSTLIFLPTSSCTSWFHSSISCQSVLLFLFIIGIFIISYIVSYYSYYLL